MGSTRLFTSPWGKTALQHTAAPRRGVRLLRCSAAALWLAAGGAAARAHATWADGSPVPEWVTKACCGPDDAHHLRPDQVRRIADGYVVEGYPRPIYDAQVLPSQDGEYWAFYGDVRDADGRRMVTSVFCFFAPSWG